MSQASRRKVGAGVERSVLVRAVAPLIVTALLCGPGLANAQDRPSSGDGFLFQAPGYSFVLRGGYSVARATSDVFAVQRSQLTIGPRGFDALSLGADLYFNLTPRVDFGVTLDGTTRSLGSEYRGWTEGPDSLPIRQNTALSTVGISGNFRYNLRDRGRAVSNFAWIPAPIVPYIGVGAGFLHYDLTQRGDFVDTASAAIFTDSLNSSGWTGMAQAFTGFTYNLNARFAVVSEARYTLSSAWLNKDYSLLGRIDLSGFSLNVGTSIRF